MYIEQFLPISFVMCVQNFERSVLQYYNTIITPRTFGLS